MTGPVPITVTKRGTVFARGENEIASLARRFKTQNCVPLPGLIDTVLLAELSRRLKHADFRDRVHSGIGSNLEQCMCNRSLDGLMHFLFNDRSLFRGVEQITGCAEIGCFQGRVYRCIPGYGHHDAWHSDASGGRLAALSINLGSRFSGGVLEIRDRDSKRVLHRVANTTAGDGILFRLAPQLEHRITEVEGRNPKIAFAGWFMSEPHFTDIL